VKPTRYIGGGKQALWFKIVYDFLVCLHSIFMFFYTAKIQIFGNNENIAKNLIKNM
jgi:hypothetical protein